jgi:hypothetical protein
MYHFNPNEAGILSNKLFPIMATKNLVTYSNSREPNEVQQEEYHQIELHTK